MFSWRSSSPTFIVRSRATTESFQNDVSRGGSLRDDLADDGGLGEAFAAELIHDASDSLGLDRGEQAAGRLRVEEPGGEDCQSSDPASYAGVVGLERANQAP